MLLALVLLCLLEVSGCRASRSTSSTPEVRSSQSTQDAPTTIHNELDGSSPSIRDGSPDAEVEAISVQKSDPWTERLLLDHASHPAKGAPTVVVHGPAGFDPTPPIQVVVFLHGWSGCASVLEGTGLIACRADDEESRLLQGWGLGERHDAAGTNSLLVIPQLAYLARDGSPGRFAEKGFFRGFLDELLGQGLAHRLGKAHTIDDVDHVTLVAHSAGFKTALSIIQRGEVDDIVKEVVLFDALYAAPAIFAQWVSSPPSGQRRKIVSLYTAKGRTYRFSQLLAQYLRDQVGPDAVALDPSGDLRDSIKAHIGVIARSPVAHGSVPARHLPEVLSAFDLRRRTGD